MTRTTTQTSALKRATSLKNYFLRSNIQTKHLTCLLILLFSSMSWGQVYLANQSFDETTFVPSSWTNLLTSGSNTWTRATSGTYPTCSPRSGTGMAMFNSFSSPGTGVRSLITPVLNFSTAGTKRITFWMYRDNGYPTNADKIEIYTNTSANLTGATLLGTINRSRSLAPTVGSDGWYEYFYDVTTTSATTYVIFKAIGAYGNNMYVDDIKVEAPPTPCSGTPTAGTIASNALQNICSGSAPATLTVTGTTSGVTGITYQWEQSTDNATWSNVTTGTGATTASYTPPSFGGTTIYYRCKVTCSGSSLFDVTNTATIAPPVNPTTQVTNAVASAINYTSFTTTWVNGNGNRRVVYISDTAIVDPTNTSGAAVLSASSTYAGSGQQIIYDGTGTSVSVSGLALGTAYYVKVFEYTRCGTTTFDYYYNTTSGTNAISVTTLSPTAVPWTEGFATTTLPSGWLNTSSLTISSSVSDLNPALATNYIYTNIYDDGWSYYPSANFSTPIFAALPSNYRLVFDYKINNYGALTAPGAGTGNIVVAISTNNGSSFTTLQTINNNGVTGWQNVVIDLSAYANQSIRLRFTSTIVGYQDYYVGFDNFKIEPIPAPTITNVTSSVACSPTSSVITITGAGLTNATSVKVGGTTITPLTTNTDTQITATVSSAISGTVEVTTNGGSVTSSGSVSFAISPALTLNTATQTNCAGVTNSTLTTLTSTVSDYDTYTWSPSTNVSGNATNGWTFNPTATTTYTLTATNSAGCSRTTTKTVTVNTTPSAVTVTPSTTVIAPNSITTLTASGGTISNSGVTTIGTGTLLTGATSQPTAFCNRYDHYWSQTVFTAAELNAAGIQAGNITAIRFNIAAQGSANTVTDFKIRIGNTSNNTLSSFQTTGLTQVFSVATYSISVGVNTITFNTPYAWDGVSNLLLDVRQTGIDSSNNTTTSYTATPGNTVVYATTSTLSTSDGFAGTSPSATTSTNRLNTTFIWNSSVPTTTTWSPITDLFTDAGATTAYAGGATTTVYAKPTVTTTYTATATSPSGCTSNSSTTLKIGNTWTGTTSNSWNNASNWSSNAVPTSVDDVLIASNGSNAPLMDIDVTVPAGKSLTLTGGELTIAPGKVLTIAGSANFGGRPVTFKSAATGTAMLGSLTGTLTGATNVTVERFIPQGKRAFRLLSPAVTTTTFISGNWQQGTHITGGATGGFDVTETNNPSMFTYNNQVVSGSGWTPIANTNATNLTAGVGYRVLVRGDRTPTNITSASADAMNAATTLTATGALKTGTVTLNSSSTPAINNQTNATTADYSLVGNPYQSAVDWNAVTKSGIDATYYAWDPNMGTSTQRGRYVAFNGTTNDNASSQVGQYIQPGQAFFVKNTTSGTAGTLTFQEAHKATTSASVFRMANQTPSSADASISMQLFDPSELAIGGYPIDAMKAVFNAEYQNTVGTGDATKLESAGENIAWSRNNTKLAIDAAAPLTTTDELLVKTLRLGANKNYTFKIQTANFDTTLTPYLVDNFLNTQTEITTSQAFLASFATTTNAASYNENRFKIVFTTSALHNDTFTNQIGLYPNPSKGNGFNLQLPSTADASVKLFNTLGQEIGLTTNGSYYQATQSLPTGVYYIMVTQGSQTSKLKWIVE